MSEHILSLSYGKDSLACLGAIEQLGWPLNRIVHAEVWPTDTIPADLPPMASKWSTLEDRSLLRMASIPKFRSGLKLSTRARSEAGRLDAGSGATGT